MTAASRCWSTIRISLPPRPCWSTSRVTRAWLMRSSDREPTTMDIGPPLPEGTVLSRRVDRVPPGWLGYRLLGGDRIALAAGTKHAATVGPSGCSAGTGLDDGDLIGVPSA